MLYNLLQGLMHVGDRKTQIQLIFMPRHTIDPARLALLPSGTSGNEALHAEINSWFRQTQNLHQATLTLKLDCAIIGKQLAHCTAIGAPTLSQMTPGMVLARAALRPLWTDVSWRQWCDDLRRGGVAAKARIPLFVARVAQASAVRSNVLKRPASVAKRPASSAGSSIQRRTPFTLKREGGLRSGGVRRTIRKDVRRRPSAD
jgi:hypothetical protein